MSHRVKVVIADDEPILRTHLKMMLEEVWPEIDIVGQAANGEEALALTEAFTPKVVFLDINMPGIDGLEVSKKLCDDDSPPIMVFVTAYNEYAVTAFENQAIDYLLKPLEKIRLEKTVQRIKKLLSSESTETSQQTQLQAMFSQLMQSNNLASSNAYLKWIKASKNNHIYMIDVDDVDYFIADNKYTEVTAGQQKHLIKTSITHLESELEPDTFWRIHRNCIVRVDTIDHVSKDDLGHVYIYLKGSDEKLSVSRKYHHLFKQM
ncbi:LytR/AlgR family response regulator transcription factor [Pseudoalteromonas fuliginea]|uniref:Response regulator transcription factor n=1 Tax=Pseudoalteromonas fuliginea TaxID=1872678 RepID=A0ABQ6RLN2_9GAMM|nr:LytTR family DNA-binding domain-containing protein [Pseudoalteromonas fuliginea]KAA1163558.1 response regulator transcription factor [Pseudoalteromonas fuliginea]KAA1168853.1 response regulator transcription factor [Pseudoalteromonas fuliginea]